MQVNIFALAFSLNFLQFFNGNPANNGILHKGRPIFLRRIVYIAKNMQTAPPGRPAGLF